MVSRKGVFKNSVFLGLDRVSDKVGALIFAMILARLLQPELFGVYQLALSIGFLFTAFTDLGVGSTMIRWVSYALGKEDNTLVRSYYKYLLKIKLLLLFFAFTILFFASPFLTYTIFGKPELLLPLQIMAAYISLYSFFSFLHSTFLSLQVMQYSAVGRIVFEVSRIVIVPVIVIAGFSVWGAILGTCVAIMFAVLVLFSILVKKYPYFLTGKTKPIKQRALLTFLSYLTLSSISGLFFINIDSVMLGFFLANEFVGFYKAASAIVFSVIGVTAITSIMLPVFTQLESNKLKDAFRKVFRYNAILSIPATFMLIWIANPVIKVIYGHEYLPAALPLIILSFLVIEGTIGSYFWVLLNAKEMPKYPAKIMIVSSILNIILNFFLIQWYGITGAAFATLISRYFNSICLGVVCKLKFNISPELASVWKPLLASAAMMLLLMVFPSPHDIFIGVGEVLLGGAVYFAVLYLIKGWGKDDWAYFKNIIFTKS